MQTETFKAFLNKLLKEEYLIPLALLLLCLISFGVLIPWLGFFWDDWPLAWYTHALGPESFIGFAPQRPFSGVLYFISTALVGEKPIFWQIYALFWRWVMVLAFWWFLRKLWPDRKREATVIACLFAIYPGFTQQSIALIYSLYYIYYALFIFSLNAMLLAFEKKTWGWTIVAVTLMAAAMLSTEYFYGLELLRVLIIWFYVKDEVARFWPRAWTTVKRYLPYVLVAGLVFVWRFFASKEYSYSVMYLKRFRASPSDAIRYLRRTILGDVYEAMVTVWARVFRWPDLGDYGTRVIILNWLLVGAAFIGVLLFFWLRRRMEQKTQSKGWYLQVIPLGIAALFIGGLSFWMAELPIRLDWPWDRGMLPMAFGSSILLGALVSALRPKVARNILLATIIATTVGFHFQTGMSYLLHWRIQKAFFQQLTWRAPALEPDTIVMSEELPIKYYTDNSLTGPLNWIYAPDLEGYQMPYFLSYIGPRWGIFLPEFEPELAIEQEYRNYMFNGSMSQAIVVYFSPSTNCLRVLDPAYDSEFPELGEPSLAALNVSNPAGVISDSDDPARLPEKQFGAELAPDWCYYFEKADLARQLEDWERVVALGDEALAQYDTPYNYAEYIPFILGYAYQNDLETAQALTREALRGNENIAPMLCQAWREIETMETSTEEASIASSAMFEKLACTP
ncbi:MAG: hypothetical protein JXB38_17205 [Anaerolineales bacterium]|nr:hypothetical protein [Anaerolineales bacterium]